MSAGTPPSTASGATTNKRWWLVMAGTVAVLAVGGLATQFWRAQPGSAAEESGKASGSPAKKAPTEHAAAKVGKLVISEDVLARECVARHGREVLDDLINRAVIQQACEARGVEIKPEEVEAEIVKIAKRFNLDPVEWQKMLQAERNISPKQYRESVIWPMLALRKLAEEPAQEKLTEEDLQKEFARQYGERAKVRMIMLDNLRRAQDCWSKCKRDPESFDKFAQEYSIDPNSRSLGGTIPPIPRHSGNETIEKEAFKLQKGEISGVIEVPTPAGTRYAILQSEGRTEPVIDNIEEVREQLYEELMERKVQENIAKVFEKIKAETTVRNYLTQTVSGPDAQQVNPAAKGSANSKPGAIKQTSGEKGTSAGKARIAGPAPSRN